uniref:TVP38/TMEM64 family protein n=1 Tax=Nitratireductor aquibiodomus TaxID=204799 RepID=UPI0005687011
MNALRFAPRILLLLGIVAAIVWAAVNRDRLDIEALDAWVAGFGLLAPLAYLALYAVGTVAFLPGALFALAGGALFGPVWGSLLNLVGATIGASLAFLIARYLAGDWVAARTGGRLKRLIDGVEAEGWRFVAFVRLVPLFPFNLTNYALGLTRISFATYVVTSFICMAPGAIAYTWLGHAGREALAGNA